MKIGDLVQPDPETLYSLTPNLKAKYTQRVGVVITSHRQCHCHDGNSVMVRWHDDIEPECEYTDGLIVVN